MSWKSVNLGTSCPLVVKKLFALAFTCNVTNDLVGGCPCLGSRELLYVCYSCMSCFPLYDLIDGILPLYPRIIWKPFDRASDNSRGKKWNFTGFQETNSRRKRLISREFSGQIFVEKQTRKQKKNDSWQKYWKDVKFRARKKHKSSSNTVLTQGNCTCFERQEKHIKLYRNAWPVNLLFQLQFRAENSNAINFFPLIALLCCFAVYKTRLF